MKGIVKSVAVVLILCFILSACGGSGEEVILSSTPASSDISSEISSEVLSSEILSSAVTTSAPASSKKPSVSKKPSSTTTVTKPVANSGYQYNTNLNIEDNVFMDSLIYTGYNMKKHRADGLMWVYILAKYKRAKGWLSNITYAGGSTGYETKNGKPDIKYFERNGFVCASFATYVYFNYLPNVAGIDTSSLPRPADSKLADSWYKAVQQWVKKGYSREIKFTASIDSSRYIVFKPKETIPIGSIIIFRPHSSTAKRGSHVVVYAGYKNGNHWVYHVGTKNGPEMCAVERMLYGPEPQWPLMVVTTPSNIRFAASLDLTVTSDDGTPVVGAEFSIKNTKTGAVTKLGKTNASGKIKKDNLNYGDYTLTQTAAPAGYTAAAATKISLNTKNNSLNSIKVVNKAVVTESVSSDTVS